MKSRLRNRRCDVANESEEDDCNDDDDADDDDDDDDDDEEEEEEKEEDDKEGNGVGSGRMSDNRGGEWWSRGSAKVFLSNPELTLPPLVVG